MQRVGALRRGGARSGRGWIRPRPAPGARWWPPAPDPSGSAGLDRSAPAAPTRRAAPPSAPIGRRRRRAGWRCGRGCGRVGSSGIAHCGSESLALCVRSGRGGAGDARTVRVSTRRRSVGRRTAWPTSAPATGAGSGSGRGSPAPQDNLPTMADQIVKVRSERARWFGPGPQRRPPRLATSATWRSASRRAAPALRDAQPPSIRALVSRLRRRLQRRRCARRTTPGRCPTWCAGAGWIREIDELDLYAYLGDVALMASGRNLAQVVGRAEAPGPGRPGRAVAAWRRSAGNDLRQQRVGGRRRRHRVGPRHGARQPALPVVRRGPVLGVPPDDPRHASTSTACRCSARPACRWGSPTAWPGPTRSRPGHRFTLYRLDLVPGAPTSYRYGDDDAGDDVARRTRSRCRGDDGAHDHGRRGRCGAPTTARWSTCRCSAGGSTLAFTYRDANLDNDAVLAQFLGMDQAHDLDEFQAVYRDVQGLPWVNTLAADRTGRVWYTDALGHAAAVRRRQGAVRRAHRRRTSSPRCCSRTGSPCSTAATPTTSGSTCPAPAAPASSRPTALPAARADATTSSTPTTRTGSRTRPSRSRATRRCGGPERTPAQPAHPPEPAHRGRRWPSAAGSPSTT